VGRSEACHKCSFRFCAGCRKRGSRSDDHGRAGACELTKQLPRIRTTPGRGGLRPDEGSLRLLADVRVFVRRGAGELGDEGWDLLESLKPRQRESNDEPGARRGGRVQ